MLDGADRGHCPLHNVLSANSTVSRVGRDVRVTVRGERVLSKPVERGRKFSKIKL